MKEEQPKAGSKEYVVVLAFVCLLVVGVSWLINFLFFDPQIVVGLTSNIMTFDSRLWRTNQHRRDMVVDLIIRGKLNGLTREQLLELLGHGYEFPLSRSKEEGYEILLGAYWLMVHYDNNNRVDKVSIRYYGS
jgi:hypothetical protein